MRKHSVLTLGIIGIATGFVTGIFGGGGGMILVPMLTLLPGFTQENIFPSSVCIILPICMVSIFFAQTESIASWQMIAPYLLGSLLGGILSGFFGQKIPVLWLHRILGIMVLWGGFRYLCMTTS